MKKILFALSLFTFHFFLLASHLSILPSHFSLFTFHFFLLPPLAHAQSAELSISPPVVEALVAPGKSYSQVFHFKTTKSNVIVTPTIHKVTPVDDMGHTKIDPNPLDMEDLPFMITASPQLGSQVSLVGNELPITLNFEAAGSDIQQDVYLALVVRVEPKEQPNNSSLTSPAISSLIMTTITRDTPIPIDLEVVDFALPFIHDSWLPLTLSPKIQNNSMFMIRPKGKLELISLNDKILTSFDLYPHLTLGQSSRKLKALVNDQPSDLTFPMNWRMIGPHKIKLTIISEGGTKLQEIEKTIWIIPIRVFTLSLLILVILYRLTRPKQNSTLNS